MKQLKPRWWQLYLLGALWLLLLWLVHYWHASESLHEMAQVGITFCCFGALNMWLAMNSAALEHQEQAEHDAAEGKAPPISRRQARYRWAMRRKNFFTSLRNH